MKLKNSEHLGFKIPPRLVFSSVKTLVFCFPTCSNLFHRPTSSSFFLLLMSGEISEDVCDLPDCIKISDLVRKQCGWVCVNCSGALLLNAMHFKTVFIPFFISFGIIRSFRKTVKNGWIMLNEIFLRHLFWHPIFPCSFI